MIKVQRSYSEYSSANYLISPPAAVVAAASSAEDEGNGESDEEHDAETGSVAGRRSVAAEEPLLNKHALYQRAVQVRRNSAADIILP